MHYEGVHSIYMRMKTLLSLLTGILLSSGIFAQDANCYLQWQRAFDARGGEDVKDGWHEDVVVAIRTGNNTQCLTGKVLVEGGVVSRIFLMYVDGKYELFTPSPKGEKGVQQMTISNGITRPLITIEEEIINVIFPKALKPKKPEFRKAPPPPIDDL